MGNVVRVIVVPDDGGVEDDTMTVITVMTCVNSGRSAERLAQCIRLMIGDDAE